MARAPLGHWEARLSGTGKSMSRHRFVREFETGWAAQIAESVAQRLAAALRLPCSTRWQRSARRRGGAMNGEIQVRLWRGAATTVSWVPVYSLDAG